MKKICRILPVLLAVVMALGCFAACKHSSKNPNGTEPVTPVDPGLNEDNYVYNYSKTFENGTEFTFLNLNELWNMYIQLDAFAEGGNKVDKAVYGRNRQIEQDMNCSIKIDEHQWSYDFDPYLNKISNAIMNNMCPWDAIYLPINRRADMITQGNFRDLSDISTINLDGFWWDETLNKEFMISDRLYFASSPYQLMSFDTAWGIFYNIDLMNAYGMQNPRDLVASNEWTLDTLMSLCQQYAGLNGAESYYWSPDTKQVYGIAAHPSLPDKLIYASGERYVSKDEENLPIYSAGSDRFTNVVGKLANFLGAEHNLEASAEEMKAEGTDYKGGGYIYAFANSRAIFMGGEIKVARELKSLDTVVNYGLAPLPKYEAERDYYTPIVENLLVMTIPVNCQREEDVGAVLDALSFYGYKNVLPVYYDNILYRGYTEEDQPVIEILKKTRGVDIAYFYGWNSTLAKECCDRIFDGTGSIASKLASEKISITTSIETWKATLKKLGI